MFELILIILRSSLWLLFALAFVIGLRFFTQSHLDARARYRLWIAVPIFVIIGLIVDTGSHLQFDASKSESTLQGKARITQSYEAIYQEEEIAHPIDLSAKEPSRMAQKLAPIFQNTSFVNSIGIIWIMGFLLMAVLFALSQWRFHRTIMPLVQTKANVFQSNSCLTGPALVGCFKPKIIVPKDFTQRYDRIEQALVLAHERTHQRSGDNLINAVTALMQCIFWFHPLVHLAARFIRIDQEVACDALVMTTFPRHKKRYATLLLKTELFRSKLPIGALWPAQSETALKQRIVALDKIKYPALTFKKWAMLCSVTLICSVLVFSVARASASTFHGLQAMSDLEHKFPEVIGQEAKRIEAKIDFVETQHIPVKGLDEEQEDTASKHGGNVNDQAMFADTVEYKKEDNLNIKYDDMRETLYAYLIQDDFISSRAEVVTMRHFAEIWTVNNRLIPSDIEGKYFKLSSTVSVEDSSVVKIELKPDSLRVVNVSCSCDSEPIRTVKIRKYSAIL